MVSESDISVQGHGVHTAYTEMARGLGKYAPTIEVVRGEFGRQIACDIIHLHTVGSHAFRKLLQKGPKKVVSAHVVPDSFVGSLVGASLWKPIATWYLRWFYNRADLLLAVSEHTADELRAMGVKTRIEVLHNCVDTDYYKKPSSSRAPSMLRQELGIPPDTKVVIGAGQVQPRKRVDLFVEAAAKLPDVAFVWVGGVPFGHFAAEHAEMKSLMSTQLSNLHFTGTVPLETMKDYYHMADIFWLPSMQETFGLVVVEAAAAGLPIVLRESEDYAETFGDDAEYGSDDTFVEIIRTLCDDPKHYHLLQKRAERIAERFDSRQVVARLVSYYQDLL